MLGHARFIAIQIITLAKIIKIKKQQTVMFLKTLGNRFFVDTGQGFFAGTKCVMLLN